MTTQVTKIYQYEDKSAQSLEANRFQSCEQIVDELVEQGLPSAFNPDAFISKISKTYDVSFQEAKTCLKLAVAQLDANKKEEIDTSHQLNAQSGYFYPKDSIQNTNSSKDGMDSLSSLSSYNRLMFGLR